MGTNTRDISRFKGGLRHVAIAANSGIETETVIVDGSGVLVAAPASTEPIKYTTETGITAGTTQTQAGATTLTEEWNNVTTVGTAGDGIELPTAATGLAITAKNSGANTMACYPNSSDSINALAVNLAINIPVGGTVTFRAISATVWETNETVSVSAPTTLRGEFGLRAVNNAADHEVLISNASHGQATVHTIPDPGGATGTIQLLEGAQTVVGAQTFSAGATFSAGLVGDVNGTSMAVTQGSGWAGVTTVSSEITKQGKIITTHLFLDIAGLIVSTTLLDIIGDSAAANSHGGQFQLSESGQIVSGSVTCLEAPTTGVADIDFYASSASTGVENAAVSGLADPVVLLANTENWTLGMIKSLALVPDATSDYLYLAAGVAGTPGTYAAGQFLIELIGYEA